MGIIEIMSEKISLQVGSNTLHIETGKLAKQADGAVTVQLGETIVLVAAVAASSAKQGQDFFPLTVDYREKAAAAGKFPGGYFKREGRPTEKEILTSRVIDRPIRPLFPKGWYNEVQVQSVLLSADGDNDPDILAIVGASAALMISDIPWDGPLGAVRVGRVNDQFIANPTHSQMLDSDLDLVYVGNATDHVMFEGAANEISESDFVAALKFGHDACQPIIAAQKDLAARAGKQKRPITLNVVPEEILKEAKALAGDRMVPALLTHKKLEREAAVKAVTDDVSRKLVEKFGADKVSEFILKDTFYYIQKEAVRSLVLNDNKRLDGRGFDDVRPISGEVGILPRAHGSAIFARGETQAVVLATLGTTEESQEFDSYTGGTSQKQFILHYNFPNFSVGETGRISGPGRREIGHGALAERSIEPMIPLKEFPYAIRVTCEIMESNGSTSMASVCGGSLALMDAGVPMTRPVAGISVGICTEFNGSNLSRYKLLTDIIGWEDAFCDMDCKIAGTEKGITGFQLDLKLRGLPHPQMVETIEKARVARLFILGEMSKVLPQPRKEMSKYAPRILTIKINPEKIGALIGPGGKNIKRIVDESGCEINIEDDGTVKIYSVSEEGMKIARSAVEGMTAEIEVNKTYRGKVVSIKEFGCFVEVFPGKDGLCHISELANFRVKQVEDIVKIGDEIMVKCIGIDEKGRVKLSRRAAMEERDREMAGKADRPPGSTDRPPAPERSDRGSDRPADRGSDRGSDRGHSHSRGGHSHDRPERADRGGDRPSRGADRPYRTGGADRPDRGTDRPDRGGERSDRSAGPERSEPSERSENSDRPNDRSERPERGERSEAGDRSEKTERPDRGDRPNDRRNSPESENPPQPRDIDRSND